LPDLKINEIEKYYLNINSYVHSNTCTEPWVTARINNRGHLYPCMDYYYGDLKKETFKSLWNNEKARIFRKTLKKVKLFPGCVRCCKI
jgi:radical SAM protein with 4Fe4S-binding SPASM domain